MNGSWDVDVRRSEDDRHILNLWQQQLPQDWVGWSRWYDGVLLDTNFLNRGCFVVRQQEKVLGFAIASKAVNGQCHLGVIAVDASYVERGIGTGLWEYVKQWAVANGVRTIQADGMLPHIFIPGIDEAHHLGASEAFRKWGFQPAPVVWSMHCDLESWKPLASPGETWNTDGMTVGPIPDALRAHALEIAQAAFGAGWVRAARETWMMGHRFPRVLGVYEGDQVYGLAVVGGHNEPVGRLGPIGLVDSQQGKGLGSRLLQYTLRYMKTLGAPQAYFLHCDDGTPAYRMYLKSGFVADRRFVPHVYQVEG